MSSDAPAGRDELTSFLAAARKGWRTVAVNVLNHINVLGPDEPISRELVLNLRSVTEQLEREQRAAEEAALKRGSEPVELPDQPSDPLAGLTLYRDDEAA